MGALSLARAAKFQERYDEWDEQDNEGVPKWHYGSHYSSAGIVALFLIRLEPFTQHYVRLQSGRFDVPDRIFCNIQSSWCVSTPSHVPSCRALCMCVLCALLLINPRRESASGSAGDLNLSDVRELIPEFLYAAALPWCLGKMSSGSRPCVCRVSCRVATSPSSWRTRTDSTSATRSRARRSMPWASRPGPRATRSASSPSIARRSSPNTSRTTSTSGTPTDLLII